MLARSPTVGVRAAIAAPAATAKSDPVTAQTLAHFSRVTVMESLSITLGLDGDDEAGHPSAANRRQQRWEPIELGHTNLEPAELRHFLRLPPSGSDPRSREAFWVRRGAEEDCPEWTPSVGLAGESSPLTAVVEEGLPCD